MHKAYREGRTGSIRVGVEKVVTHGIDIAKRVHNGFERGGQRALAPVTLAITIIVVVVVVV